MYKFNLFQKFQLNLFQHILVGTLVGAEHSLSHSTQPPAADLTSVPQNCHEGKNYRIFIPEICPYGRVSTLKLALLLNYSNKFLSAKTFGDCQKKSPVKGKLLRGSFYSQNIRLEPVTSSCNFTL